MYVLGDESTPPPGDTHTLPGSRILNPGHGHSTCGRLTPARTNSFQMSGARARRWHEGTAGKTGPFSPACAHASAPALNPHGRHTTAVGPESQAPRATRVTRGPPQHLGEAQPLRHDRHETLPGSFSKDTGGGGLHDKWQRASQEHQICLARRWPPVRWPPDKLTGLLSDSHSHKVLSRALRAQPAKACADVAHDLPAAAATPRSHPQSVSVLPLMFEADSRAK